MLPNQYRRLVLFTAAPAFLSLVGCNPPSQKKFNGIDLAGAQYAQQFSLLDPNGKERSLTDFHGQAVLIFFGFTQCPDVCPTALTRAAEVRRMLGKDANRLQVLFVTLDPERDTPEVLKAYTSAFDPSFIGLSTSTAKTEETAKAFKIFFKKVPTGSSYTLDHSTISYLYDEKGILRVALQHEMSAEVVAADVRMVLNLKTA